MSRSPEAPSGRRARLMLGLQLAMAAVALWVLLMTLWAGPIGRDLERQFWPARYWGRRLAEADDEATGNWALRELSMLGPAAKVAIPELCGALGSRGTSVRAMAAGLLGDLGGEAVVAVPDLARALDDEQRQVRWTAATALSRLLPLADAADVPPGLTERVEAIVREIPKSPPPPVVAPQPPPSPPLPRPPSPAGS